MSTQEPINAVIRIANLLSIEHDLTLELAQALSLNAAITVATAIDNKARADKLFYGYEVTWNLLARALEMPRLNRAALDALMAQTEEAVRESSKRNGE